MYKLQNKLCLAISNGLFKIVLYKQRKFVMSGQITYGDIMNASVLCGWVIDVEKQYYRSVMQI